MDVRLGLETDAPHGVAVDRDGEVAEWVLGAGMLDPLPPVVLGVGEREPVPQVDPGGAVVRVAHEGREVGGAPASELALRQRDHVTAGCMSSYLRPQCSATHMANRTPSGLVGGGGSPRPTERPTEWPTDRTAATIGRRIMAPRSTR